MWPFRRHSSLTESGILRGMTDWHSHILPGVDDGVGTMKEALAILAQYERLGIGTVWCTPHIMEDIPNRTAVLRERFAELQAQWKGAVELHLAAENMLDNLFIERLEAGDLLPLGLKGDHLLVETSYFNPPMHLYETLARIQSAGYYPVLAHPERYVYMSDGEYEKLRSTGVKLQLNLLSLTGIYGKTAQQKARQLRKKEMYEFAGSDLHTIRQCAFFDKPI